MFRHGLAYKAKMPVNWCTSCKCVLANEEVVDGVCERCHSAVVRRDKSQWMLKITEYAQRLIDDLELVDYPERVKTQQKNWIGRSTGAEVDFTTSAGDTLTIYTTRPDTLYGATYMVISPEHPYIEKWADKLQNIDAVREYRCKAPGRYSHKPGKRPGDSHFHFRLCAGFLWHRGHYGGARPRYQRLGFCQEI